MSLALVGPFGASLGSAGKIGFFTTKFEVFFIFSEYEDRINDLTDAEVIDSYLRTLPKVILWKLR